MTDNHIQTLPEKLTREIARVTTLRAEYVSLDGMPNVNVKMTIMILDRALEAAKRAAGSADIEGQIAAVKSLEGCKA